MHLSKQTFYKVACRVPNHIGYIGRFYFNAGDSLWLNKANANTCLATAGIRSHGASAPYLYKEDFFIDRSRAYVDEQACFALHIPWPAFSQEEMDAIPVPEPEPIEPEPIVEVEEKEPFVPINKKELVKRRKLAGITQAEAAKIFKVAARTYKQWECINIPKKHSEEVSRKSAQWGVWGQAPSEVQAKIGITVSDANEKE